MKDSRKDDKDSILSIFNDLIQSGTITTIYGPGGSGKTLLCILLAEEVLKNKKNKIIYVDTEGGFSVERFLQVSNDENILERMIFLKPKNFNEQKKDINHLVKIVKNNIKLIIVDTIAMQYRLELANRDVEEGFKKTNKELIRQISILTELARTKNIPVVLTNQVYTDLETGKINMVGGEMLKYGSKCLIELMDLSEGYRQFILRKHRSLPEKSFTFKIINDGISIVE